MARARLDHASRLIAEHLPGWTHRRPAGGLSLWLRIPSGDAAELTTVALRHGVALVPGVVCSPSGRWTDYIRLPFAGDPATLEDGIRRIAAAWTEHAGERRKGRAVEVVV
jgi:DNA-binding transcriptional MocR family regulator